MVPSKKVEVEGVPDVYIHAGVLDSTLYIKSRLEGTYVSTDGRICKLFIAFYIVIPCTLRIALYFDIIHVIHYIKSTLR